MKRKIVSVAAGFLCTALFVMPVSAHGHHGQQTDSRTACEQLCAVCTEEGCTTAGWHIHDDVTYCGYEHESGYCDGTCDVVQICTEDGCTKTGRHKHNGETFCGYSHESGYCDRTCGVVEVCTEDGCTKTGRHKHNGETFCGYGHESGYCDQSCENRRSTGGRRHGRHHGHH